MSLWNITKTDRKIDVEQNNMTYTAFSSLSNASASESGLFLEYYISSVG